MIILIREHHNGIQDRIRQRLAGHEIEFLQDRDVAQQEIEVIWKAASGKQGPFLFLLGLDPPEHNQAWELLARLRANSHNKFPIGILTFCSRELLASNWNDDNKLTQQLRPLLFGQGESAYQQFQPWLHPIFRYPLAASELEAPWRCVKEKEYTFALKALAPLAAEIARLSSIVGISSSTAKFSSLASWHFLFLDNWVDSRWWAMQGNPIRNRINELENAGWENKPKIEYFGTEAALQMCYGWRFGPLREVDDRDVDAVFLDLIFGKDPDLQQLGMDLLPHLVRWRPDIPIYGLSVERKAQKLLEAVQGGASWYFFKHNCRDPKEQEFVALTEEHGGCGVPECPAPVSSGHLNKDDLQEALERFYVSRRRHGAPLLEDGFLVDRAGLEERIGNPREWDCVGRILGRLFKQYARLFVLSIPVSGRSGHWAFFVRPVKTEAEGDVDFNVKLVKIGNRFDMNQEKRNYDDLLDGYVDSFLGVLREEYAEEGNLAGIVYSSVGPSQLYLPGEERYPKSLASLIREGLRPKAKIPGVHDSKAPWRETLKHLERTYDQVLRGLYRHRRPKPDEPILKYYGMLLPPLLSLEYCSQSGADATEDLIIQDAKPEVLEKLHNCSYNVDSVVFVKGGRVYETEYANHAKKEGRIRLYDEKMQLKLDILYPRNGDASLALEFEQLAADPRLRRGKRLDLRGKICKNRRELLASRLREGRDNGGSLWDPYIKILELLFNSERAERRLGELGIMNPVDFFIYGIDFKKPVPMTVSRIHGDLNLDNILVSDSGSGKDTASDSWLIDFAKTQEQGHLAYDFVKLEVEMRTQLLADLIHEEIHEESGYGQKGIQEIALEHFQRFLRMEQALPFPSARASRIELTIEEFLNRLSSVDGGAPSAAVQNLMACIMAVRCLAAFEAGLNYLEYLYALFFYALAALKFRNLADPKRSDSAPLPLLLAYGCAAVAAQKIERYLPSKRQIGNGVASMSADGSSQL
jgi:hypothetical protein